MTQEHPIIPPPELVEEWAYLFVDHTDTEVFNVVAQWGADQELEACCEWLSVPCPSYGRELRNGRRPKPQSLKEQALETLKYPKDFWSEAEVDTIRLALEQLND